MKEGLCIDNRRSFFGITCIAALTFIDGMARGYSIAFVSFFIALWGIAVAALFFHRARVMDVILNSNQLLAHWVYHPEMARDSAQREYREFLERNSAMFILIGGMLGGRFTGFHIFYRGRGSFQWYIPFGIHCRSFYHRKDYAQTRTEPCP
jgi:hypothetical protein